ncbi:MAG: protein-L-isoaspartate(D-aspartate) O-methyltransferase [Nitrososphaerota archaeon]|jgi:protein-L-isoaspartate(D-aspartate) O-methyltransferase|nr:protein-L-isoaspartate(D-aspartate) O-methyltransferase [Nitrososphaerota archaeon]
MDFEEQRRNLVARLKAEGIIISPSVEKAMLTVPREEFVWAGLESQAYVDAPLPISDTAQTISAPHMVAIMLEKLDIKPGMTVLEVGTGSGYNAALIAELVGLEGKVVSIELIPKLAEFATSNLSKTGYGQRVQVIHADGSFGYPRGQEAVYDRICVTAASASIPNELVNQLKPGGIMLLPVGGPFAQRLVRIFKDDRGEVFRETLDWVSFVPLRRGDVK